MTHPKLHAGGCWPQNGRILTIYPFFSVGVWKIMKYDGAIDARHNTDVNLDIRVSRDQNYSKFQEVPPTVKILQEQNQYPPSIL